MKNKISPKFLFILLFLVLQGSQFSHANSTPEVVIKTLHQTLIQNMKEAKDLGYDGRYKALEPIVRDSFDFKTIARIVMGRHWKKLDTEQQADFINVFSSLSVATYAAQFDSFSNESFEYLEEKEMKKGRVLVKTKFVTKDRVVPFNYVFHFVKDKWRIISVVADGISDLSLKRSDYTTIMKSDGFDGLVRRLREKIKSSSGNEP